MTPWSMLVVAAKIAQHIALRDEKAPYRGKWMIGSDGNGHYWASRNTEVPPGPSTVVEERCFRERHEASLFMRHLLLHGWSVYDAHSGIALMDQLW